MGLFFTLLYVFGAFMTPEVLYGDLARYHIQVLIAFLALVFGLFQSGSGDVFRLPQSLALAGLIACVCASLAANGFFGPALESLLTFLPNAMAFYFIALCCKKKSHLQLVILSALVAACFDILQGALALQAGEWTSPFLLSENVSSGTIYRLRGLGLINDPNDLGQLIVALFPLTFIFWRRGQFLRNLLLVYVPVAFLAYGVYLTHSRGAMLATLFCCLLAVRRKLGTIPAALVSALGFVGLTAINFSGGRDISAAGGADRMEAWSTGMDLIRSHPVLGVGYQRFTEFYYITAHNTVVVCAAEIGIIGFFFWVSFVYPSVTDAYAMSVDPAAKKPKKQVPDLPQGLARSAPAPQVALANAMSGPTPASMRVGMKSLAHAASAPFAFSALGSEESPQLPGQVLTDGQSDEEKELLDGAELRRVGTLVFLSIMGFLLAGWFLSRAFQMILFVLMGISAALAVMGRRRGLIGPSQTLSRLAPRCFGLALSLVLAVYLLLRFDHLLPK